MRGRAYQKPLGKPDSAHSATPSHNSELQWMSSELKSNKADGKRNDKVKQRKQTKETRNNDHSPPIPLVHIQDTSPEPQISKKTERELTVPEQELWRLERGKTTSDHMIFRVLNELYCTQGWMEISRRTVVRNICCIQSVI